MNNNSASTRTLNLLRFSGAFIVLLFAILACNLPFMNTDSTSEPETPAGPSVMIQTPMPGTRVAVGESFDFLASAKDEAGVVRLDLWIDGTAVLSQASPDANGLTTLSLMYPLVATQSGTYALTVRAFNSKGESSDSAIHYVTVTDEAASSPEFSQYIVQDGETLDSIAQKLGISVDDLLKANPQVADPNQVQPGQVLLIPVGAQQPVQAAIPAAGGGAQPAGQPVVRNGGQAGGPAGGAPAGNPPAGQPANPPGGPLPNPPGGPVINVPGIVPVFIPFGPQQLPALPPGVVQLDPSLFPVGNMINPPNGAANHPSDIQASVNGCQVTLRWTDNASDETDYRLWRTDPGQPMPHLAATLAANTNQYQDNLPRSGKYNYLIEYHKKLSPAQNDVLIPSAIFTVEAPSSVTCPGGPKRVVFQPVSFQPSDASLRYGFVNVSIGDFTAIRVPVPQQTYYPTGKWAWGNDADRWAIPMPELATMQRGDSLRVEIQGNASTEDNNNNGNQIVIALGQVMNLHTYESMIAPDAKNQIWEAKTADMTTSYRIWLEDWQWGGAVPNPRLPAPWNVKLSETAKTHSLSWTYYHGVNPLNPNVDTVDGFIVYASYFCSNGGTVPQGITSWQHKKDIDRAKEPPGCACSYQISAFNELGESPLSAPTTESCQTLAVEDSVEVTFESIQINTLSQPMGAPISLFANAASGKSESQYFPLQGKYALTNIPFNGAKGGNKLNVPFTTGQSRTIQIGFFVANLCQGQMLVGQDMKSWQGVQTNILVKSADGNCEALVSINGTAAAGAPPAPPVVNAPPANPPAGQPANPPANQPNNAKGGMVRFVNNTSHPIVSLGVHGQEVILTEAQAIAQGGWLDVANVGDGSHAYVASNGFWSAGNKEILLQLPKGGFVGNSGTVTINDPTIEELLSGYGTSRAFNGDYWDGNNIQHPTVFCFDANGTFDFYDNGQKTDSGTFSLVSRQPGAYTVTFNVQGGTEQFNGTYSYAGPQMGTMFMRNGPPTWPLIEYHMGFQCPAK
jgi:LysM repeat protein